MHHKWWLFNTLPIKSWGEKKIQWQNTMQFSFFLFFFPSGNFCWQHADIVNLSENFTFVFRAVVCSFVSASAAVSSLYFFRAFIHGKTVNNIFFFIYIYISADISKQVLTFWFVHLSSRYTQKVCTNVLCHFLTNRELDDYVVLHCGNLSLFTWCVLEKN